MESLLLADYIQAAEASADDTMTWRAEIRRTWAANGESFRAGRVRQRAADHPLM